MAKTFRNHVILLICASLAVGVSRAWATDSNRLHQAVELAAGYLVRAQDDTGLFDYDVSFAADRPNKPSSIVRQAGAGFALAEYLHRTGSDTARRAVRKLLAALVARSILLDGRAQWLVSGDGTLNAARTGATALALVTEILYFRASGDGRFEDARAGWLDGLLAVRVAGEGFRRTPLSRRQSAYFDGEAWLALAHHFETFREPRIGSLLAGLDAYLMERYGRTPEIGFYHWGVMAAAVRHRTSGDARFASFIEAQTRHYLDVLRPEPKPAANTCYAVEGLATAAGVLRNLPRTPDILDVLNERLMQETANNLAHQLRDTAAISVRAPGSDPADLVGLFFARADRKYSRIDHTQHCLSAFLKLTASAPPLADE